MDRNIGFTSVPLELPLGSPNGFLREKSHGGEGWGGNGEGMRWEWGGNEEGMGREWGGNGDVMGR